jgi:Tfp pilus assembly PilM family ATPase
MFTLLDNILLGFLSGLWKYFEEVLEKSYKYKINITIDNVSGKSSDVEITHNGKKEYKKIIVFGLYDPTKEIFKWNGMTNKLFYEKLVNDGAKELFRTMEL